MGRDSAHNAYFTRLFEQYHRELYAYAFSKVQDSFAAEEIVQNTFIRYWQKKGNEEIANPAFFLFFIAKGLLIDHLRRKNTAGSLRALEEETLPLAENPIARQYEKIHNKALARQMAAALPERQRQIVEMNYYEEMPHHAIAAALKISPKTVRNLLSRALKSMRGDKLPG